METKKLFKFSDTVTKENIPEVMQQAIALELATIPTYLSTYYSINRAQNQDTLYAKIHTQLTQAGKLTPAEIDALAQELKVDVLVYSNKAAALIMSVVIEEMLHLALACNVKQAVCQIAPDLMGIGKILSFPTQLDGHIPEFQINAAKLSLNQLTTFLQIESPEPFEDPYKDKQLLNTIEYKTIGRLYELIITCIKEDFPGPYNYRPQLLPPDDTGRARPFYSQNSMNTVHYDRDHNPQFANEDESGGLLGVYDANSAIEAIGRIIEQGEGKSDDQQHILEWGENKMPVPLEIVDGKAVFWPGDYDDTGKELAHFAKFLEVYSFGGYYQEKFSKIQGLDDFFSYFVYNTDANPQTADYAASGNEALALCSELGNAVFAYILLMIEACYYKDESTQYDLFMYGIHKSMIWLLSGVGNQINKYTYTKNNTTYQGALTFEPYLFEQSSLRPKAQIMNLVDQLAKADPNWSWATDPKYDNYFPALPDVGLDYSIVSDVPKVPSTPYTHQS
ncbi:ferritin-like protein [Flavobacterium bizetiae]|uniref:ferritin-like protein n=1 Tax=Flavobacterium bizetiae TaxID=2704140 RepID=UPI0021E798DF|nr:ferritin-like protein [Flavobacterium bizetiae]UTN03537.1 ferritin-like protein [Flavobacterium bizetiae]